MTIREGSVAPRRRVAAAALWAAVGVFAVAGLGGLATELGPWYRGLKQPWWQPPDAAFGPAWSLIYLLSAIAAVRVWLRANTSREKVQWLSAWAANGFLNVLWSWLFFKARRPDWALAEVALLWLSIVCLIALARRRDGLAALLLVPYLLWVAFAASLNHAVVRLNGPFT
jgi:tryptophan-rich sensory protein